MADSKLAAFDSAFAATDADGSLTDERGQLNRGFQLNSNLDLSGKEATFTLKGSGRKAKEIPIDPKARTEAQCLASVLHKGPSQIDIQTAKATGDHCAKGVSVPAAIGKLSKLAGIGDEVKEAYIGYASPQNAVASNPEKVDTPRKAKRQAVKN